LNSSQERKTCKEIIEQAATPDLIKSHEDFAQQVYEDSQVRVHLVYGEKRRKVLEKK
jgi:hypothetical protein